MQSILTLSEPSLLGSRTGFIPYIVFQDALILGNAFSHRIPDKDSCGKFLVHKNKTSFRIDPDLIGVEKIVFWTIIFKEQIANLLLLTWGDTQSHFAKASRDLEVKMCLRTNHVFVITCPHCYAKRCRRAKLTRSSKISLYIIVQHEPHVKVELRSET